MLGGRFNTARSSAAFARLIFTSHLFSPIRALSSDRSFRDGCFFFFFLVLFSSPSPGPVPAICHELWESRLLPSRASVSMLGTRNELAETFHTGDLYYSLSKTCAEFFFLKPQQLLHTRCSLHRQRRSSERRCKRRDDFFFSFTGKGPKVSKQKQL